MAIDEASLDRGRRYCAVLAILLTMTSMADAAPTPDPVIRARPKDEAALMTYDQAYAQVRTAPNDIARQQIEDRWDRTFCANVNSLTKFSNWTGRVKTINENGYLEIDLGGYITLDDIDILPNSPLYKAVASLHEDQPIRISGYFTHGGEACDIFVNREFGVHLTSISPF